MINGIGAFLMLVGAIIMSFALSDIIPNVDLVLIGYILMVAGAFIFLISFIFTLSARRQISTTRTVNDGQGGQVRRTENNL